MMFTCFAEVDKTAAQEEYERSFETIPRSHRANSKQYFKTIGDLLLFLLLL